MTYEHTDGYKIRNQSAAHFLTFTTVGWIDIFTRDIYRNLILENFEHCRKKKGLMLGAYVIMSNHIHTIWTAKESNLSGLIRDFKGFTSKQMLKLVDTKIESRREWLLHIFEFYARRTRRNDQYKVWSNDNHPEEIFGRDFMQSKLNYIHQNPVRAGLVADPGHYLYSSASNYQTGKGIIEIDYLY